MVETENVSEALNHEVLGMTVDPPLEETYKALINEDVVSIKETKAQLTQMTVEECELPLINLGRLNLGELQREECKREIAKASQEWGFFQVVNHGISGEILEKMRSEQVKLFNMPFHLKADHKFMNFSACSYRWGTPTATCLTQLSWSEAFHVPLTDVSASGGLSTLSSTMEQFALTISGLARKLAEILAEKLGHSSAFFDENCFPTTCYLRMNRYPPCPISSRLFGLMPHTDSDFLTILQQDQIGGLQLVKDGKWIAVKPDPEALIVNIGDLFQAWSNDVYKSVEHRVVTNQKVERFSTAYFLCPSFDTVIRGCTQPSVYRDFSFGEYRQQVQEDVRKFGYKIGLPRFLL